MTMHIWPALELDDWRETFETVHRWTQIVGKTRLALSPTQSHWWHVALYVSTRGLRTSPIPYGHRTFEVELDFVAHMLIVQTSDGTTSTMPLMRKPTAELYDEYMTLLRSLDIEVTIWPVPVEVDDRTPFTKDDVHCSYDPEAIHRYWQALVQVDRVFHRAGERWMGKASPVHFWWGSFDLAHTRYSGRLAPPHPGGLPHIADRVVREAYSHECASIGFWPGGGAIREAAFYAYVLPEPAGYTTAAIRPAPARYDAALRE